MQKLRSGRDILLWVCALFLAGSQTALPGILRIKKHSAIKAGEPKHCVSVDMRSI